MTTIDVVETESSEKSKRSLGSPVAALAPSIQKSVSPPDFLEDHVRGVPVPTAAKREWAAYVRVSKVMGREGDSFVSPRQQETAIRMALDVKYGAKPHDEHVFIDVDKSGRDDNRPNFQRMLEWVYEAPVNRGICVMDGSRLFRNSSEFTRTVKTLEALGAEYLSVHEAIDSGTPEGTLMHTMLAAMHQFQSDAIARRWRMTQKGRVEDGLPSGGAARFGYEAIETVDEEGRTRRARIHTPHPINGPILARMYEEFLAGRGAQTIAKNLNDRGETTSRGQQWSIQTVLRTLDCGFGAGKVLVGTYENQVVKGENDRPLFKDGQVVTRKVRIREEFVDGKHEALITPEQWEQYLRTRESRRKKAPRHKSPRWHLAGLAKCGLCGANLLVSSYGDPKTLVSCGKYKSSRTCTGIWIRRTSLDRVVTWWLSSRLDELARHASSAKQRDRALAKATANMEQIKAKLEKLSRERVGNVRAHSAGDLTESEFSEAKRQNAAETATAQEALTAAQVEVDRLAPVADVYDALIKFGEQTDDDPAAYNTLLARVIDHVDVTKTDITIYPVIGDSYDVPRL